MQIVNIHEAKIHLSRLVEQAAAGEEILITRAGEPVARLVPWAQKEHQPRILGLGKGRFAFPSNFDSPHSVAATLPGFVEHLLVMPCDDTTDTPSTDLALRDVDS